MPIGAVIEFTSITKKFGQVTAVNDLSFTVEPGRVTGFLGPNGAGKTTTLRMLLGLVAPTSGTATFGGLRYRDLPRPLHTVGAALEAASFHPGRTAAHHLGVYTIAAGIPRTRVAEVLHTVGLAEHAGQRVGGYSLGMRQRLGLAYSLLGDPGVLVLDEPINGLDPEGIKWIRGFLSSMAAEGRTVLVSSHLLSEVQQSVDDVIIIAKGELVHSGPLSSLDTNIAPQVIVDSPDRDALIAALTEAGLPFTSGRTGLIVAVPDPGRVGHIAFAAGVELNALHRQKAGLEESFLALVEGGDSL
ncbi:ABC transporter ATP-binding protein [Cryobacterium sp. LW097]|uniref:ATP-binding cassette domain-containing protein n=1 Tax=unclassified Cryobacterium TaxID=2649013 RepID=UPI000B4C65DB|nr:MULTISPECIES: ATP-binding cassette domain-containing protein [unclassified Cryobacterium]ASD20789.1 ABC transporter ATP-binding protein [Cryobacterium sp. LW097]TFC58391.1 ATP-binding cassette domain-containing protein [Cryobacterium sp. TMB1-7]TFC91303.1 ATP-binding cassette domain-containing protein [Cryobacterium sp. TMT4-31]